MNLTFPLLCALCAIEPPPPLTALAPFPGMGCSRAALDQARAHLAWLEGQALLGPREADAVEPWRADAEALYRAWDCLDDALCECASPEYRRLRLADLREMLGEEAFWSGRMPPAVPVWRFREAR